jgi:Zn-dependent protease
LAGRLPLPGGAVMINTAKLRSRNAELAVAACGPLTNALFICVLSIPFAFGLPDRLPQYFDLWLAISSLIYVEVIVLLLNLIPIPPLDGFHIISYWLSYETQHMARQLGYFPLILLYFMLRGDNPFGLAFYSAVDAIMGYFQVDSYWGWYALRFLTIY